MAPRVGGIMVSLKLLRCEYCSNIQYEGGKSEDLFAEFLRKDEGEFDLALAMPYL